MNNFKNMKIEVNAEQPLEEIERELEMLGYLCSYKTKMAKRLVIVFDNGCFGIYSSTNKTDTCEYKPITLAELKGM